MDRRNDPTTLTTEFDWRGTAQRGPSALASTDARWALVSTSLTALIAGSIAWLAIGTMAPANSSGFESTNQFQPYRLFQQLTQSTGNALYAALGTPPAAHNDASTPANGQLNNALAAEQAGDNSNSNPGIETHTVTLDSGDTLAGALEDVGISADDANAAIAALSKVTDPRGLRAGQSFDVTFATGKLADQSGGASNYNNPSSDDDTSGSLADAQPATADPIARLLSIKFSPSIEHDITIVRGADGTFAANDAVKQLEAHVHRAGATIDTSLYLSAMQAGIPADVVVQMIHMFSYKVDFQRDLRPGDTVRSLLQIITTRRKAKPAKQGNIAYATMRLGGREMPSIAISPTRTSPPITSTRTARAPREC